MLHLAETAATRPAIERPDFVIAGAAKCGTTALFSYLAQHPSVFVPDLKEPDFFNADMPGGISSLAEYRALFESAPPGCLTGEASTGYLYSRVAIAHLLAHNPLVKVIVMLREPVEAAYSLHGYAYRYGHESIADFERAWRAQGARLDYEGRGSLPRIEPVVEYDYRATYRYAEQVRRVLQLVPPQQRLFLIYEEFFATPREHYAGVLEFLGLAPAHLPSFEIVNAHVGVRSPKLERFLRQPPALVRAMSYPARSLMRRVGLQPRLLISNLNRARRPRAPLRPAFRLELEHYFSDDVAQLQLLLGRRLWRPPDSTGPSGVHRYPMA